VNIRLCRWLRGTLVCCAVVCRRRLKASVRCSPAAGSSARRRAGYSTWSRYRCWRRWSWGRRSVTASRLALDARVPALAVAALLVWRSARFLVVVLAAAGAAALLRAIG
jgi:hypothetical protein